MQWFFHFLPSRASCLVKRARNAVCQDQKQYRRVCRCFRCLRGLLTETKSSAADIHFSLTLAFFANNGMSPIPAAPQNNSN